jgi:mannose-6-phosphate isomerase-like protein (cupin superfamily)
MAAPAVPVNLADKLSLLREHWSPKIVAEANNWHVKVVKVQGEFVWHKHEDTDEIFLVISGELVIRLHNTAEVRLREGEIFVVPRGVAHQPVAAEECEIVLLEPAGTVNTGQAASILTAQDEWI